jgi:hypothetical protein
MDDEMTTQEKNALSYAVRVAMYTEGTRPQEALAAVAEAMAYALDTTQLDAICLMKWWAIDAFVSELDRIRRDAQPKA